jgi:MFS family permease
MPALHLLDDISPDTSIFPWAKRTPLDGLRAILAVAIALLIGQLTGHESAGAIAAGSAFTVGFAIFHETLSSSLLSMGLCTLSIATATLAGSLGAQHTWLVLALTLIAAINYGLLSGISPTAGWVGQQAATYVIVAAYFPKGTHYAVGRTGMVLAGGGLQMIVFTGFFLLRHSIAKHPVNTLHTRIHIRVTQLWTKLRTEASPASDTYRYVLRLALTLLLCTAIYRRFHVRNGYWAPMTALLVLKPQWTDTLSRGIARLTGTLIAAAIAVILARYVSLPMSAILALVIVCGWACYAFQAVNYAFFSLFITLYIVFLFRSGGFSQTSAAHIRLFNTALGGALALAIDTAWKLLAPKPRSQSLLPNL